MPGVPVVSRTEELIVACRAAALCWLSVLATMSADVAGAAGPTGTTGGAGDEPTRRCLYISSYHVGYPWSDGVERGLRAALDGHCEIAQFDLDTKRQRTEAEIMDASARAFALVEELRPDVIITSDDNAARHVIVPYLRGTDVPVVFSGVNWTVAEYGFPLPNVTGIVEVAPLRPMWRQALELVPRARKATYIGANTLSEVKNYERMSQVAREFDVALERVLVASIDEWRSAFVDAQKSGDLVIVGSSAGIDGWSDAEAGAFALEHSVKLSFTSHDWMMPVTAIGFTKVPDEHGEVAGRTAIAILEGTRPIDIPIRVNRRADLWINDALIDRIEVDVPERLTRGAKRTAARR